MSFLAGRAAAKEGAYFFQESKQVVNRLVEKSATNAKNPMSKNLPSSSSPSTEQNAQADMLPEILRHSLSFKISDQSSSSSSLYTASKWALASKRNNAITLSHDALNPLRAHLSLPQVSLGSKRWEMSTQVPSTLASTANELRKDRYDASLNPEKLKAVAEGLSQVGKAFAIATAIVFGGATVGFGLAASKLQLHNSNDIRTKGKGLIRPKFENMKEQMVPLKTWAEDTSKKWHLEREEHVKEKSISKELSKMFSPKTFN